MLSQLFQDSDYILYQGSGPDKRPQGSFILDAGDNPFDFSGPVDPVYFSINPTDPYNNRNEKGERHPRASINVTAFRNFLFEIDSLPLDVQLALLRYLAPHIPFAQVTFSGGSSYHAIISVADTLPFQPHTDTGIAQYSQAWKALDTELRLLASKYLGGPVDRLFDGQCKDPARLSRTPGALRPDTNKLQTEIDSFGGYISADQVLALMAKHSETSAYQPTGTAPTSNSERGILSKRTQNFIANWKPALADVWPWHPEFIFAVKDLQSQNYSFDEARAVLQSITGYLDSNDIYQMRDVWSRQNFRLDFRPVSK